MLLIVGALIVLASVAGGYLMHGGDLLALNQPSELLIIGGAALGSLVIGTPLPLLKRIASNLGVFFRPGPTQADYLELLGMMYQTFRLTQQSGVMALEPHCDDPASSSIFSRFPRFLGNHHAVEFFTDSVRVVVMGGVSPYDLEAMMDADLEVHHHEALKPSQALAKVGDALPGMGIVAAVLGVVITMGAIDGPPNEIGHKVGAALVGTFLGILMCYGFVGPMATALEHRVDDEAQYLATIKAGVLAMSKGLAPAIAVEFARRTIPAALRPGFSETEQYCRAPQPDAQAEAA
ncbi:MAG TPA: flagellar motor stator protein MotA [Vicinamibacterales bacterium]